MNKNYKVALLCTCWVDFGVRALSAILKKAGIETEIYFLGSEKASYSKDELIAIISGLRKFNPDLIGISSILVVKKKTTQLVKAIRKDKFLGKKKIIWGGVQAMAEPDFCLKYADAIGIGECDISFLELVNKYKRGEPYLDTPNFIFNHKGKKIINKIRPLIENLDMLPFEDYQFENHKFLKNSSLVSVVGQPTEYLKLLNAGIRSAYPKDYFKGAQYFNDSQKGEGHLFFSFARGCYMGCTYCFNNYFKKIYPSWGRIRIRSNRKAIENLKKIIDKLNPRCIFSVEDDFFLRSTENIKEFSELYGNLIKKPFLVQCTPWSFSEEKFKILLRIGLNVLIMGIQSGSERIRKEIYHRYWGDNQQILKVAGIINKYITKYKLSPPWYDFIFDNPYEDEEDILATINLIAKLPPPFFTKCSNLVFFPHTELYEMAKRDNLLEKDKSDISYHNFEKHKKYWKKNFYLNLLLSKLSRFSTATHIGEIERRKLKKLTDKSFIRAIEKRKDELLSKNLDLNSLV